MMNAHTDAELVYMDEDLHLVCLNAETNTSHVLLDNWSLVRTYCNVSILLVLIYKPTCVSVYFWVIF